MEVAVLSPTGELRKFTPRWVEHVVRREERVFTENTWRLPVVYKFNIGRQGLRMREMVGRDMEVAEVVEDNAMDRTS